MLIYIILFVCLLVCLLFFLPIRGKRYERAVPEKHIDERDTMFSRNELKPDEEKFADYYNLNPEKKEADDKFRTKPGLLGEGSTFYNELAFASADASFTAVEALFGLRYGEANEKKSGADADKLSLFIKKLGKKAGVVDIGIAEMKDYHFYTKAGRKERYGSSVINKHKYAVAFIVEMDHELTNAGPNAPVVMESARQYLNAGMIATQLALTLRNLGYEATSHIDANYDVICPLVAKDAGLGEIGRMGILISPRLGPRVRIAVVSTDAPLIADEPCHSDSVLDFCTKCKKCAVVCPSASISHSQREQHRGGLRWQIDQEACFAYWCQAGTDCGRCIAVCPYSHKDNALHRFARWGIRNNLFFRRVAVSLDDLFYGKKPAIGKVPEWLR